MAIPSFRVFLRPVLEAMAESGSISNPRTSLISVIKSKMGFSDEEAMERLESGGNRLANRIGWALTYLKKAGLITFPKRGIAEISELGQKFLLEHSGPIYPNDLEQFQGYVEFKNSKKINQVEAVVHSDQSIEEIDPEEKINIGYKEIKEALIGDILERLLQVNPTQFEEIVLQLIRSLGYGIESGKIEHTGGSGDFGIDGIVHLDRLSLDKIYLQAKRYKPENKISGSDIQAFYGALKGQLATKGVFITTSSYQNSAIEYAKKVSDTIALIDGRKLAELMIEGEVGVSAKRKLIIPEIDSDFFV